MMGEGFFSRAGCIRYYSSIERIGLNSGMRKGERCDYLIRGKGQFLQGLSILCVVELSGSIGIRGVVSQTGGR